MKDKKFEKRKQQLIQAIERDPKDIENHLILGKFYFVNECYAETIEIYKKLLEYHPRDISVLYNLAVAYNANKQPDAAKQLFLKILRIDPSHKPAQDWLVKLTTFK